MTNAKDGKEINPSELVENLYAQTEAGTNKRHGYVASEPQSKESIERIRSGWQIPKLLEKVKPDVSGQFGVELEKIDAKLGTGFLIILTGNRGCGKTQMGVELMKRSAESFRTSLFIDPLDFFSDIKATYKKDSNETEKTVVRKYRKPRLLVIDEIGQRGETDWENQWLFKLLNHRYYDMTDTLMTCNLTPEEIQKNLGDSLISRLNQTGGIIHCTWPSFR